VPVLAGTSATGVAHGGYVLADFAGDGTADGGRVVLIGTGSEVQLAVAARDALAGKGIDARVVSMPSMDVFADQDADYRDSVIPPGVRARVSVEAGIAQPWYRWIGDAGEHVGIEHFGASADALTLFREFGITADAVVAAAERSVAAAR